MYPILFHLGSVNFYTHGLMVALGALIGGLIIYLLAKKEGAGGGGLEYPHYTRPEVLKYRGKKYTVPETLLSGRLILYPATRICHI